jgi:hypothetical protein
MELWLSFHPAGKNARTLSVLIVRRQNIRDTRGQFLRLSFPRWNDYTEFFRSLAAIGEHGMLLLIA